MIRRTIKKSRGTYKKKNRIVLTEKERRNYSMTYDILNGMTFNVAASTYGMNSAQATQKAFRLTVVNFFLPYLRDGIVEKKYDIGYLRGLWVKTKL